MNLTYIANCTQDDAWSRLFADATEMACAVEIDDGDGWGSVKLVRREFEMKIGLPDGAWNEVKARTAAENFEFGFNETYNVAWAYDSEHDIHHFWHK